MEATIQGNVKWNDDETKLLLHNLFQAALEIILYFKPILCNDVIKTYPSNWSFINLRMHFWVLSHGLVLFLYFYLSWLEFDVEIPLFILSVLISLSLPISVCQSSVVINYQWTLLSCHWRHWPLFHPRDQLICLQSFYSQPLPPFNIYIFFYRFSL